MRTHALLLILIAAVSVALVIDILDGYAPKTITTAGLAIGL